MIDAAPVVPPVAQESYLTQEAIVTKVTTVATTAPLDEMQGSTLVFDEQMMEELFRRHSDPFADLPFEMGGSAPATSSSMPTADAPSGARAVTEEEMFAQIDAEMAAAAHGGSFGGGMAAPGPAPLRMLSPGGTVFITSVPIPPSVLDPVPPTPPVGSIPIHSSSEEDVEIMPSPGDRPPKGNGSKRKNSGGSSGSTPRRKPRKKKD